MGDPPHDEQGKEIPWVRVRIRVRVRVRVRIRVRVRPALPKLFSLPTSGPCPNARLCSIIVSLFLFARAAMEHEQQEQSSSPASSSSASLPLSRARSEVRRHSEPVSERHVFVFGDDDDGNGGGGFSSSRYQPVSAALSEPRQPRRNIADLRFEHNNSDSSDNNISNPATPVSPASVSLTTSPETNRKSPANLHHPLSRRKSSQSPGGMSFVRDVAPHAKARLLEPDFWSNLPLASQAFLMLCAAGTIMCLVYAVYLLTNKDVRARHPGSVADQLATFLIATAVAYMCLVLDAVRNENAFQLLLSVGFELAMALRAALLILSYEPTDAEAGILVVGSLMQVGVIMLARTTYRQFGWRIYSRCAVDLRDHDAEQLRERFLNTQRLYTAIKVDIALLLLTCLVGATGAIYDETIAREDSTWLALLLAGVGANTVQAACAICAARLESRAFLRAALILAPLALAYTAMCISAAVMQKLISSDLSPAYMVVACILFTANRVLVLHTLLQRAKTWRIDSLSNVESLVGMGFKKSLAAVLGIGSTGRTSPSSSRKNGEEKISPRDKSSPPGEFSQAVAGTLMDKPIGPRLTFYSAAQMARTVAIFQSAVKRGKVDTERKRRVSDHMKSRGLMERLKSLPKVLRPLVFGVWVRKLNARQYAQILNEAQVGELPTVAPDARYSSDGSDNNDPSLLSRFKALWRRAFAGSASGELSRAVSRRITSAFGVASAHVGKRRFFQLAADGTMLRWAWEKYVLLHYIDDVASDEDTRTISISFVLGVDPPLNLQFDDAKTHLAWAAGLMYLLSVGGEIHGINEDEGEDGGGKQEWQADLPSAIQLDAMLKSQRKEKVSQVWNNKPSTRLSSYLNIDVLRDKDKGSRGPTPKHGSTPTKFSQRSLRSNSAIMKANSIREDEEEGGDGGGDGSERAERENDDGTEAKQDLGKPPSVPGLRPIKTKADSLPSGASSRRSDTSSDEGSGMLSPSRSSSGLTVFQPPSPRTAYRQYVAASLQVLRTSSNDVKLGRFLGGGAEGQVFTATLKGSPVVVKFTGPAEATMSAFATHPPHENIVAMRGVLFEEEAAEVVQRHGVMVDEDTVGIVFEYCTRGSLRSLISHTKGALLKDSFKTAKLVQDIAVAMAHLHDRAIPILHRDLKTANVFVSRGLGLKVGDYGQARTLDYSGADDGSGGGGGGGGGKNNANSILRRSLTAGTVGTCAYAAPELISPPDERGATTVHDARG